MIKKQTVSSYDIEYVVIADSLSSWNINKNVELTDCETREAKKQW